MVVCVVFHPDHSLCESPNLFFHHGNFFVSKPLIILFFEALHSDCVPWLKLIICLVTYQYLKLECECSHCDTEKLFIVNKKKPVKIKQNKTKPITESNLEP